MKMILVAVFSGIFLLIGAACSAAEMEVEVPRAPVVKPVWPKYRSYRPLPKSKRKVAKQVHLAPAILVPASHNNNVNDKISEDVTQSWQPYSYP